MPAALSWSDRSALRSTVLSLATLSSQAAPKGEIAKIWVVGISDMSTGCDRSGTADQSRLA